MSRYFSCFCEFRGSATTRNIRSPGNQTVNLEADPKTLYFSLLKLRYCSPSIKQICLFKQQPQKSHKQDILQKNLQINRSLPPKDACHEYYFASLEIFMCQGCRMQS